MQLCAEFSSDRLPKVCRMCAPFAISLHERHRGYYCRARAGFPLLIHYRFLTAAQRGWSIEETANKLSEVSAKAHERAEHCRRRAR